MGDCFGFRLLFFTKDEFTTSNSAKFNELFKVMMYSFADYTIFILFFLILLIPTIKHINVVTL